MHKIRLGTLPCFQFHLLDGFSNSMKHALFTREGGVSPAPFDSLNVRFSIGDDQKNVLENRRRIKNVMSIDKMVSLNQTHSKKVLIIESAILENLEEGEAEDGHLVVHRQDNCWEIDDYDAVITNEKNLALMIQVADCQAALIYDPTKEVMALVHAGWKGLKQNIYAEVIGQMREKFGCDPNCLIVGIAPSLGPENSEFTDPLNELGTEFKPFIHGKKVNLWEVARKQLAEVGVEPGRIELAQVDTADANSGKHFFSYRREKGQTGRFALVGCLL